MTRNHLSAQLSVLTSAFLASALTAQAVPFHQSVEPGPALSPDDAIAKMELPEGFKVECVAHEPQVINPTSFTFDDQGRIWVTESVEYPRADAGPGQDRVKILEDVNHDGHLDKVTVFKEGLNIPCGVAIGNGGVYVTNSPDVLFLQDSSGSGHADKQEVLFGGFGRDDRHELPNSLTWGPDGWLYGMNGVFNQSRVKTPDGKEVDFTCAIWRYHPKTKKFELFAEGTSNPWGLDYNRQGDWFVSCCVIDHLFHMTQSGYYERQGGPYPPMTHWLRSITTERHEAAAYGGLCLYDADAFPAEYRGTLLMGNLHGSCLNHDTLTRNGSTYTQHNAPDFLSAHDAWFMPVSEKIGPDGCLYVMDWYDRYHCYQDAGRDPQGVDRTRGRIYRISYHNTPYAKPFDLGKLSNDELLKLLGHSNVWWRRTAQRLLNERFDASLVPTLQKMALDTSDQTQAHMHALWLLVSQEAISPAFADQVMTSPDASTRNWGARAVGQMQEVSEPVYERFKTLANDPSPDVRVQVAVAAGRLRSPDPLPVLMAMLDNEQNANDPLIPTIIYNNLKLLIPTRSEEILSLLDKDESARKNFGNSVVSWTRDAANALSRTPKQVVQSLERQLHDHKSDPAAVADALQNTIESLARVQSGERAELFNDSLRQAISDVAQGDSAARTPAIAVALWWNDEKALQAARTQIADTNQKVTVRSALLKALAGRKEPANIPAFSAFLSDAHAPVLLRQNAVDALGEMDDAKAADAVIAAYPAMPADLKPMAINALVRSKAAAQTLLAAIKDKRLALADVNENHARRIISFNDPALTKTVTSVWGTVRTERNPERVKTVEEMKKLVLSHPAGNPVAGWKVFEGHCQVCHTIYGKGADIGPNLTGVGRENLDVLLSNVIDPNLVVGAPYYQWVARQKNGEIFTGLLVEDSEQQVVLRDGTQRITIAKKDLKDLRQTHLSMMPEGLEKTMSEQDFCDLVAFMLTKEPPK